MSGFQQEDNMRWFMGFIFILFLGLLTSACAVSPTGRKQLMLVPESQMDDLGAQAFTEMKEKTPIERGSKPNEYVSCIVSALTKQVDASVAPQWEVVVFDEPKTVNAFALPGGKVGVYTGIIKVANTQDQLAAVIGHEIGHVIAQHGRERVSTAMAAQTGLAAASIALQNKEGPQYGLLMGALGLGAQVGILLPHSRTQESEADKIGLELMAKAGFNPKGAVQLWANMAKAGGQPPEFMSTHPSHERRISRLQSAQAEVRPFYEEAVKQGRAPHCSL